MYIIKTTLDDAVSEFNFISNWINSICKDILNQEVENNKISIFYNYGYFVPKGSSYNISQLEMMYDDRLKHELSKVRVNVTIKIDHFIMTNRIPNKQIPDCIKTIVNEITKLKMKAEYEIHRDDNILKSVPAIDESIVSIQIDEFTEGIYEESEDSFDIDNILDKIQTSGIESLSSKEKEFLDKKSKEM